MGSGVIYAMVIGLWALVLVPTWLRNHEQSDEGKQVDRFRRAMSELSNSQMELVEDTPHKRVQVKRVVRAGATPVKRMSAAQRRLRVLAGLAALQVVGVAAAILGASMLAVFVPAMLIASFLTLARSQVRAERVRRGDAPVTAPVLQQQGTFARTLAAARAARRAAGHRVADVVEQAPAAPTVDAPPSWQPVRTPAPSYVSAPAATAVPRAIDAAGGWTGDAMVAAARAQASDVARAMAEPAPVVEEVGQPLLVPVDADTTAEIPVFRTA